MQKFNFMSIKREVKLLLKQFKLIKNIIVYFLRDKL